MIDPKHDLPIVEQAKILDISRTSVYYRPRPVCERDLALMRAIGNESSVAFTYIRSAEVGLVAVRQLIR
jgi:hypothetical protein